jgi:hypothetical protein
MNSFGFTLNFTFRPTKNQTVKSMITDPIVPASNKPRTLQSSTSTKKQDTSALTIAPLTVRTKYLSAHSSIRKRASQGSVMVDNMAVKNANLIKFENSAVSNIRTLNEGAKKQIMAYQKHPLATIRQKLDQTITGRLERSPSL